MMEANSLLHNAARQYCISRAALWRKRYADLTAAGLASVTRDDGSWAYTDDAYRVFPRYNVLEAILNEVETFVPTDFATLAEARALLVAAGETAQSEFTRSGQALEITAMLEERQQFVSYINNVDADQCASLPQLPFRRVLTPQEHQGWRQKFAARWGHWYGGFVDRQDTPPHITLHTAVMDQPGAYEQVRRTLVDHSVARRLELREWEPGYELDIDAVAFLYDGREGFWTDPGLSWMVNASHESSITFGGSWLIERMRACLHGFDRYVYKGWDLSVY